MRIKNLHFTTVMFDLWAIFGSESGKAKLYIREECLSSTPSEEKFCEKYENGKDVNKLNILSYLGCR